MPPSKHLRGSEDLSCLYVNLPFFRKKGPKEHPGNAPQKFVGYDIKLETQIVLETRLHNNNKYGRPLGPLWASFLNQTNQLLELLAMVEDERELIRGLFIIVRHNVS